MTDLNICLITFQLPPRGESNNTNHMAMEDINLNQDELDGGLKDWTKMFLTILFL